MTEDARPPIEHSIWIDADPGIVFEHFVDERKLVTWMGAVAKLDPAPGGEYRVVFKEGWVSSGKFLEVVPPTRLVYSVGWEGNDEFPPASTRVEIRLATERGGTRLHLKHFGPPPRGLESDGWLMYLGRLAAVCGGRALPDDPFDDLAAGARNV